jgi:hypothetical protein
MKSLVAVITWYFLPGIEITRRARPDVPRTPMRTAVVMTHGLGRIAVFIALVWALGTAHWYAAALLGSVMVALGMLSWLTTRWRLGQARGDQ